MIHTLEITQPPKLTWKSEFNRHATFIDVNNHGHPNATFPIIAHTR